MKLIFRGHDDRYAVEQSLLAFFPAERPVYDADAPEDNCAWVSLSAGEKFTTATTKIVYQGKTVRGTSRVIISPALDEYEAERQRQKAVKLSFFKAARAITGTTPTWGALTGIRPGKLAARFLEQGQSTAQVDRILRDTYFVAPERRRLCIETAQAGLKAKRELQPEDISLYIGIPFCPTRCAYCSFVSASVEKSFGLMEPYLEALLQEITDAAQMVKEAGLRIKSFYMGGGTPTTLSAQQMDRLLTHLNRSFDMSHCVEYCIEAGRPDTITRDKLRVIMDHGADRISVNPQSLEDHVLEAIGRKHTAKDIEDTMALATSMGFPHVNMDLIAGLPEDTPEGFRRTLDKCLTFGADNITIHTLALKKGSRILLEGLTIPTAEQVAQMLDYANPTLRGAGFAPYYLYRQKYMSGSFENVGWCIPGSEGLYNIYIMEELHSILSLGAGGSTKMVDASRGRIERVFHPKFPKEYIERPEKLRANLEAFRAFHEEMKK
ncbi:MAG: coproporphyrinogen dehydrogenase HemZ [Clostridiales bacterium]|nr:coproporphyrinogen dehydrogenase HemZ [Candidatus Cacconaster stercorequi]